MLFNLFGSKKKDKEDPTFKDRVYIEYQAKMNACALLAKEQPDTIFIAWFTDTAKQFKAFFIEKGLDEKRIIEARYIHATQFQKKTPVFVEHYPVQAKEMNLVENWNLQNILVYSSLNEPFFKYFGSDKIIGLLKMTGMQNSEAVEHSYVTESIIRAQKNITDKVIVEKSANSQAEWMERNLEVREP